ncbi:MAG: insulinase family protein [Myxococcales bacterium]|nr:insulinase family protein [Myxococcales bacterium]
MNRTSRVAASSLATLVISLASACCPAPAAKAVTPTPPPVADVTPPSPPPEPPMPPPPPIPTQTAAPQDLAFPDEPFRASQPVAGPPRPFQLPKVQTFKLANGIQVYLVEQHTLPIVSLDLTFDGGAENDPVGKEGLASVCMSLMSDGTEALDKIGLAEALADTASSVSSYAGSDTQGLSMSTLSKHLDATFGLFVDTLRTPGFRADEFDRAIKRRLEGLKQARGSADAVASRVGGPVLYGAAHPFGRIVTEASLGKLTVDDCKAHHAKFVRPGGAQLFVVGDLTADQVRARFADGRLAAWKGKVPARAKLPAPKPAGARIVFVDMPGAAQSQVGLSYFGPKRTAPDYFPTSIMASIFGGGFTSRLNMNLREDKGYSYGARGGVSYNRDYGVIAAGTSVRSDATYQTLLEIVRELRELRSGKRPPTDEELTREKASAVLGMPSRFATAGAALGMFRALVYYRLPLDYWGSYVGKVGKVAQADVVKAAARYLDDTKAVYLVVGDATAPMIVRDGATDKPLMRGDKQLTLREALELLVADGTLGPGGLLVLDADGQPVP